MDNFDILKKLFYVKSIFMLKERHVCAKECDFNLENLYSEASYIYTIDFLRILHTLFYVPPACGVFSLPAKENRRNLKNRER